MDDRKIEAGIYQSISHWGMFDRTITDGVVTIHCDSDGLALGKVFEHINEVLPLLVVHYHGRGTLVIHGDHSTGIVRDRTWFPEDDGMKPPHDQFTSGMQLNLEPASGTRH